MDLIHINTQGFFKKAKYDFNGKIKNGLNPPFIVKNLDLELDNVDVERFLTAVNNQNLNNEIKSEELKDENDIQDDDYVFDTNLIRIEDCDFHLQNGKYKELTFGDIKAKLTLDKNGILNISSNKFNIL